MTGIELITKERLKQVAYYPDDSKYTGEFYSIINMLLRDSNDSERYDYKEDLLQSGFNQETLNKWNSRSQIDKLKMIGAFCAAQIDILQNSKTI